MNKMDIVTAVAKDAALTRKAADAATAAVLDAIAGALAAGDKVMIAGFGSFEIRNRPARTGRNPRTGEAVQVPASKSVAFKAGKALKDKI